MKSFPTAQMLGITLLVAHPADAASVDSTYTSLDVRDCKTLELREDEGGSYRGRCPGTAGYRLELIEGDLRQTLTVIDPKGRAFPLNLWSAVSGGFSLLGNKAEWRVQRSGGRATPIALIVRYNVNEDPESPEKSTSYLVVSKITPDAVCVTDVVRSQRNANEQARALADEAAGRPCRQP